MQPSFSFSVAAAAAVMLPFLAGDASAQITPGERVQRPQIQRAVQHVRATDACAMDIRVGGSMLGRGIILLDGRQPLGHREIARGGSGQEGIIIVDSYEPADMRTCRAAEVRSASAERMWLSVDDVKNATGAPNAFRTENGALQTVSTARVAPTRTIAPQQRQLPAVQRPAAPTGLPAEPARLTIDRRGTLSNAVITAQDRRGTAVASLFPVKDLLGGLGIEPGDLFRGSLAIEPGDLFREPTQSFINLRSGANCTICSPDRTHARSQIELQLLREGVAGPRNTRVDIYRITQFEMDERTTQRFAREPDAVLRDMLVNKGRTVRGVQLSPAIRDRLRDVSRFGYWDEICLHHIVYPPVEASHHVPGPCV